MVRFPHRVPRFAKSSTSHNLRKEILVLLKKEEKEKTQRRDTRVGQQLIAY